MKPSLTFLCLAACSAASVDLHNAVIVTSPGVQAAAVLQAEVEKRTGLHLASSPEWPPAAPVIAIASGQSGAAWHRPVPAGESRPEGYRLFVDRTAAQPVVWILGADPRG